MNSPYGRIGMNPYPDNTLILTKEEFDNLVQTTDGDLMSHPFGDMWLVIHRENNPISKILNVSVSISSAIAAYSRIEMTKYVMENSDTICCIDTDGIKLTNSLHPNHVGSALGLMKFEGEFKEAVFIAPKVYGGITDNNVDITKARGLKGRISYWQLKLLLQVDHIVIKQEKWFRKLLDSTIEVKEQVFRLAATSNKRDLIYNTLGMFVDTRPYELLNGVKLDRKPIVVDYVASSFLDIFKFTSLICKPVTDLIVYSQASVQYTLSLVKFHPISPISLPIIIFVLPHLLIDKIYKNLPFNLKLLASPVNLLSLPIPEHIIIRIEPSLPKIIYLAPFQSLNLLALSSPKKFLCLPVPKSLLYLPSSKTLLCLSAPKTLLCLPAPKTFSTPSNFEFIAKHFSPLSISHPDLSEPSKNSILYMDPPAFDLVRVKPVGKFEIRVYDCDTRVTTIYSSITKASKVLHICDKTIRSFLKSNCLGKYRGHLIFYRLM